MPIKLSPARFAGRLSPDFQVYTNLVAPVAPPPLDSLGAIAYDTVIGHALYEKAADTDQAESPAELVMLMTAYLAYKMKHLDQSASQLDASEVVITADDLSYTASSLGLLAGDTFTWREAIYMLMHSADGAAAAAVARILGAELVDGGDRNTFIGLMNSQADLWRMENTTFTTVNGLAATTDRSTPRDIMLMLRRVWWADSKAMRTFSSQATRTHTIDAGPSAGTIGPIDNPSDLIFPSADYGIVCAAGGQVAGTPTYHSASVWTAPGGQELIIVGMFADTSGNRYLDHRAMYLELPDDFEHLLFKWSAGEDADLINVKLLAGFDGSIVDEGPRGATLTALGDAAVDASDPIVGTGDVILDGTDDAVSAADSSLLSPADGDFAIDIYFRGGGTAPAGSAAFASHWDEATNNRSWLLRWDGTTDSIGVLVSSNGTGATASVDIDVTTLDSIETDVLFNGAKRVLRAERFGDTLYLYLNGVRIGSAAVSGSLFSASSRLLIGARENSGTGVLAPFTGNLDEFRFTVGSARANGAVKYEADGRMFPRDGDLPEIPGGVDIAPLLWGDPGFDDETINTTGNPWHSFPIIGIETPDPPGGGNWIKTQGKTVITAPQSGKYFIWQDANLGQSTIQQVSGNLVDDGEIPADAIDAGFVNYEASVWHASENSSSMDLQISWRATPGGANIRTDLLNNAPVTGGGGWQKFTLSNDIPPGARYGALLLRENGSSVEKGFDNFQFSVS